MKHLAFRTLAFFGCIAVPTVIFDLVYWSAPFPQSVVMPVEVALRLTLVALVGAWLERFSPRAWTPLAAFAAAFATYGLGHIEAEYLKGVLANRSLEGGLVALAELRKRAELHPGYFFFLFTIVASPFAFVAGTRQHKVGVYFSTCIAALGTLVVAGFLLQPLTAEVGRVTAAFVCARTLLCALLLPFVGWLGDRKQERDERFKDPT